MNRKMMSLASGMVSLALTAQATADPEGIYVEYYYNGWIPHPDYPARYDLGEPGMPSGSDIDLIEIEDANGLAYRVYAASPATEDIGTVEMTVATTGTRLFIGKPGSPDPTPALPFGAAGCRHLRGVFTEGPNSKTVEVQGRINGNLGVVGSQSEEGVDVHTLVRFDIGGSCWRP